jgi:Fe-Mn family superoxide dismutase
MGRVSNHPFLNDVKVTVRRTLQVRHPCTRGGPDGCTGLAPRVGNGLRAKWRGGLRPGAVRFKVTDMSHPISPDSVFTRRDALKVLGAGTALASLGLVSGTQALGQGASPSAGQLTLPKLPYAYDSLAPHIDAQTMEIHHTRHHQAYINNANAVLKDHAALAAMGPEALVRDLNRAPEAVRMMLRNNVGGHLNHVHFWEVLAPASRAPKPSAELTREIEGVFGSFDAFRTRFTQTALGTFGSGWAWLVVKAGRLDVMSTPNQDSPLSQGAHPVLGLDVWEHAYYLHYQNRRADYVTAFWNVVDWDRVMANRKAASRS